MNAGRAWSFTIATRIALGFLAAFTFALAALLFYLSFSDLSGAWIFVVTGFVMAGFGVFTTFGLITAVRTRITLGAATFEATVISGHSSLLVPHFREIRMPLSNIRSVERRSEIFRRLGFTTMRDALSIVTIAGERIGLFSNTLGNPSSLPLGDVANAIATAAGIPITDDGTVRTTESGLYGATSSRWTEPRLDGRNASRARSLAMATVQVCTALLLLTFLIRACS